MSTIPPRKRGRPRNPPPTAPIIATTLRSRVTRTVPLSAPTSGELDRYVAWASSELHISKGDALHMTLDRAVADLLKKDKLWQQLKHQPPSETGRGG